MIFPRWKDPWGSSVTTTVFLFILQYSVWATTVVATTSSNSNNVVSSHSFSKVQVPNLPSDEEWVSCALYQHTSTLPNCLCSLVENDGFRVNCDHVVFTEDFPRLPFRQPIISFSHRFVNNQNLPPQALLASKTPLRMLDVSHNWLRRLPEKSLEGLTETLEGLDLSHNLLGDQLNPIFSTGEFKRLPRLKLLSLAYNSISHIDGGILNGCLSMQEFYLNDNELKSVPASALKGPNALHLLDISNNLIESFEAQDFAQAQSLVTLLARGNRIMGIQGSTFRGLSSLKTIDLSFNRIHRLDSDSFAGLASIQEINLSNNFLTQIPVTSLKTLKSLRILNLSGNLLQNLEGVNMKSFSQVQVLDLSRNRLSDIPRGFFNDMKNLKEINLGVNQLRTLSQSVFEGLEGLYTLNLMDNNFLALPSGALEPLSSLQTLILDYNRISALQPAKSYNITTLSLGHNLIREIPADTFNSFPAAKDLNLRGNLISNIEDVKLPTGLKKLDLGLNRIKTIPRFQLLKLESLKLDKNSVEALLQHNFVLLSSLQELNLSSNNITTYFSNSFDGLGNLVNLDLSHNQIEVLPKFSSLGKLEKLNLARNRIKEVTSLEQMENLQYLDLSLNEISNMRPEALFNDTNLVELLLQGNKLNSFKGLVGPFERLKNLNLSGNEISYVYPTSFEGFVELWNLDLSNNRFTLFPTEFIKTCEELRYIGLSKNQIKNLNEMNFSNFPHLRALDLSNNLIEYVIPHAFMNSTQLQQLDLSGNKLETLEPDLFFGILRLELDLSNNYLSYLPQMIFERNRVQKLHKINLDQNGFRFIPSDVLQKQYFYLEELSMKDNKISEVAPNLNILVNVKSLDLSYNPISEHSLKTIMTEPKTVRHLSLANCSISTVYVLEMPFLKSIDLSHNLIKLVDDSVFKRTTLLQNLDLSYNKFFTLTSVFPGSLESLDLSGNPLNTISGHYFPQSLERIKLNNLKQVMKVEKSALTLKNLKTLELYDLPKLGYLDIRGLLSNLQYLEKFDFEVKDHQIVDQIHPGLNSRVKEIGLRGRRVRAISTGAFAGLTSPEVKISLINTSLALLPSILVPVPMSSDIVLDLTGSRISNLSPPFLSQKIRLEGLMPLCDCNAVSLVQYLQNVESDVVCAGPRQLEGVSVLSLRTEDLVCDSGLSTTPPPVPSTVKTTTTTERDIIWSLPPAKPTKRPPSKKKVEPKPKMSAEDINNMDNLIIGIVGGVVGLIVLFVFVIVCFVKLTSSGGSGGGNTVMEAYPAPAPSIVSLGPGYAPSSKCTCPYKGPGSFVAQQQAAMMNYATVRSNGKMFSTYAPSHHGGSIYAVHPNVHGSMMALNNPYVSNGSNSLGPGSLRQQMLNSMPYVPSEDYESRR